MRNLLVLVIVLISLSVCVHATAKISIVVTPNPSSELVYGCYGGSGCIGWVELSIKNENAICDFSRCDIYNNGIHNTYIQNLKAGTSTQFRLPITVPPSKTAYSSVEVYCQEVSGAFCGELGQAQPVKVEFNNVRYCGDGRCDSSEPGWEDCLGCLADCGCSSNQFCNDQNGRCELKCGNGKIDSGEECDGSSSNSFNGKTCQSFSYDYGSLSCSSCIIVKSNCGFCNKANACTGSERVCSGNSYKSCTTDANECKIWSPLTPCTQNEICSNGNCIDINTNENCGSVGTRCNSDASCKNKVCTPNCGNNIKDSGETCYTCYQDMPCQDGKDACASSGTCVDLDSEQNCGSVNNQCGSNEYCENRGCKTKCGNGVCDQGETCPNDNCCNGVNKDLLSDKSNCGSCGNACNERIESTSPKQYECSTDNKGRYEILLKKGNTCSGGQCTGSVPTNGPSESCGLLVCQDGECKSNVLELNSPCTDDVQCKSQLCYKNTCQSGVSIELGFQLSTLEVGKEMDLDLSIINTIDEDISGQLIIIKDSGMSVSGSDGAEICSGSQCTSFEEIPSRDQKSITLTIGALEPGIKNLEGKVLYTLNGQQKESSLLKEELLFYKCGDGNCDSNLGESYKNCPADCKGSIFDRIKSFLSSITGYVVFWR